MSKSVLVIDIPKTCVDCIFCQEYRTKNREYAYCYVTNGDSENDMKLIDCIYGYRQSKPDWCPLKPYRRRIILMIRMTNIILGIVTVGIDV